MERTIKASEFKATCLKLMDEVAETGDEVVITKNGNPVSRLVPYRERPKSLFGCLQGKMKITGDIMSPIEDEWGGWDEERKLALILGEDPD
ncbi:MAG: type II toxin-antitoxin system Phd/YefM family antitoxin [Acidobacteria bacterium]|nr:type II toxin-antitoxin system Phd/YefM family antitoxin [Acidobacteriota bacterium]